jgi:hypothetical protein
MNPAAQAVGSILRFDKKVNSYKLALVRALNVVVLSFVGEGTRNLRSRTCLEATHIGSAQRSRRD